VTTQLLDQKETLSKGEAKRQMLIDIGTAIFTQKGFSSTSLDEIAITADIPKGSFYYYFKGKEDFAIEVIKNYGRYFSRKLERILEDQSKSPLKRLKAFCDEATRGVTKFEFKRGCLIGNLGQEMASIEENFRFALFEVIFDWRKRVEVCIDDAKDLGEIETQISSKDLAKFFWSAWEGAVLCSKLEKSANPLKIVSDLFISEMLKPSIARNKKNSHV
jgi:TetR/AcrR family transcriptional repressor of nem operon